MKKVLIILAVLVVLMGCSSVRNSSNMPVEEKMKIGNLYFEKGKFHKAIPYFTDVAFERNSVYTAEAQMKLADCYFNQNKFTEASFEYQELIRLFNDYPQISRAYFQIGVCYYEESPSAHYSQEESERAIAAFETFIEKFPFDAKKAEAIEYIKKCHYKLLEKKYYNGFAYYKMYDYSAALMYFDEIVALGNYNELDKLSLYYSSRIYIYRKDNSNAQTLVDKLTSRYPDSKEAAKAQKLLKKLK